MLCGTRVVGAPDINRAIAGTIRTVWIVSAEAAQGPSRSIPGLTAVAAIPQRASTGSAGRSQLDDALPAGLEVDRVPAAPEQA
jgi:hypothetical protein